MRRAINLHEFALRVLWRLKLSYFRWVTGNPTMILHFPLFVHSWRNVKLGERVAINAYTHIWANVPVEIGDDTIIASHVQITTSTHDQQTRPYWSKRIDRSIHIGKNVWIGSGAILLPGITIGDHAVIGAGSIVTKDVAANTVVIGAPARPLKTFGTTPFRD